jgi:hypothetical protein
VLLQSRHQYLRRHAHVAGEVDEEGAAVVLLISLRHALPAYKHNAAALRSQLGLPAMQGFLQPVGAVADAASTHAVVAFIAAVATRRPDAFHAAAGHGIEWGIVLVFQDFGNGWATTKTRDNFANRSSQIL